MVMGGLVLASWPKPSTSATTGDSLVPRSTVEWGGQGQQETTTTELGLQERTGLGCPLGLQGSVLPEPYGQGLGGPASRQLPKGLEGCQGAVGSGPQCEGGRAPCPWGATAGAAPLLLMAALQLDRAGAGKGSSGHSTALPESPSTRWLPHTQHCLPWAHPAWNTRATQTEETVPFIFCPRPRAHGMRQQCWTCGELPCWALPGPLMGSSFIATG